MSRRVERYIHGCPICGSRFEQRGIVTQTRYGTRKVIPAESGPCRTCRTGADPPWWPEAWEARDCCRVNSRPVSDGDDKLFLHVDRLAPDIDWFVCVKCGRTHPYVNPTEEAKAA